MGTETALSRLRDSLSQLGQLDFRSEQRSQDSAEDMWAESPRSRSIRHTDIGSPAPRALSITPFTSVERLERPAVALTKALRSCQDRCSQLEARRSETQDELRAVDDDKARFQLALGRQEQENKQLLVERQKKMEETIQLRHELKMTTDRLADIEGQTKEKQSDYEGQRQRLERLVDEQRRHIESLEQSNQREKEEATHARETVERLGKGMWAMLEEKTKSLEFMTSLVSSMQSLFYNPTPFLDQSRRTRRGVGCHTQKRLEMREGVSELRELLEQIEDEIADSSQAYSKYIQRLLQREDEMKRIIAVKPSNVLQQIQLADQLLLSDEKLSGRDDPDDPFGFRPSSRKSKKSERQEDGTPAPRRGKVASTLRIDWANEMEQFKQITSAMETKFGQLAKLKKVIHGSNTASRRTSASQVRSRSANRAYTGS